MARPLRLEYEGAVYHLTARGNERIARISGSTWFATFRDESDRLSSEYTITSTSFTRTKDYFHFGSMLVSTLAGGSYSFYSSDHLGTPRLVTNSSGSVLETHKYFPYGQEITGGFGAQPLKFALMERDQTSTNDFDHARFHLTGMGRFLSVDKHWGNPEDPQAWNRYAYALDNPVRYTDPTGLDIAGAASVMIESAEEASPCARSVSNCTPPGGIETLAVTAARINNETLGMKDSPKENMPLSDAEKLIAHQRFNSESHYGENVQARSGMVAPLTSGKGYKRALAATVAAASEADPTHGGAIHYNMRTAAQAREGRPFQGFKVLTVSGPYVSPTRYNYIVTYGYEYYGPWR